MNFKELKLGSVILANLERAGYKEATPIQEKSIPPLLQGRDLLGCAQTGTGKTAAFALPILETLERKKPQRTAGLLVLVLAPTRELALQIEENFRIYGRGLSAKSTVIFGGVSQKPQEAALKRKPEILVATPGRLLDLMSQGIISLREIRWFVLDEADRMLDMGMGPDVRRIIRQLPEKRQTMLFSATLPQEIRRLMAALLKDPVTVEAAPASTPGEAIAQSLYLVGGKKEKAPLLIQLLHEENPDSVLVFSRTKHGANRITKELLGAGITARAIHGNKSQSARQEALGHFRSGKIQVLVATDIAARGIDVEKLSLVVNYDLPEVPETYVHRIGRTGRAGAAGRAISFCAPEESEQLRGIQRLLGGKIPVLSQEQ